MVPSFVVAVMVAVPAEIPVTSPLLFTVATDVLLDFHVTVLLVALVGSTVAVNWVVLPSVMIALVLFSDIDVARIGFTVTVQVARKLVPSVVLAVIVAVPRPIAVTKPLLLTVTMLLLLVVHATVLFVVLLGNTVAVSCRVSPKNISALVWSKEIDVA